MMTDSIHIPKPTVKEVRRAVQRLAGRNHMPFEDKKFHGLLSRKGLLDLIDEYQTTNESNLSMLNITPSKIQDGGEQWEVHVIEISNTGVLFKLTDAVNGAIVFGRTSRVINIETQEVV